VEGKKIIKINGQEIEVPEGFEVIIDSQNNIRVVESKQTSKDRDLVEPVNVVLTGTDIPKYIDNTLQSIGMQYNRELLKKNVAEVERAGYIVENFLGMIVPLAIVIVILIVALGSGDASVLGLAAFFIPIAAYLVWRHSKMLDPVLENRENEKTDRNKN